MKKKILLFIVVMAVFCCLFTVFASAADMGYYGTVKITKVDGTVLTGYCEINSSKRLVRDYIYLTPDKSSGMIDWAEIKIFDARESVTVGGTIPTAVGGLECNSKAGNVTEFYFPPTTTTILNTTFKSTWTSLEKVWIPKSVTAINDTSFKESAVKEVIFEEGSKLTTIDASAFQGCSRLTKINLPEGLLYLGKNCFYLSGLSGTVVVPNSVTTLKEGAFLSTKIETLVLGDGPLTIGYNFAGTFSATNNAYLKNVYIPAGATFVPSGGSQIFYKCANKVNFYIVGSEEECKDTVNALLSQSTGNYITFVTEDSDEYGAGYGVIHTGYNRCEAFYNNEHNLQSGVCSVCGKSVYCTDKTHNHEIISLEYSDFMAAGVKKSRCLDCDSAVLTENVLPMFTSNGYSAPENGDGGLSINFRVENDAIKEYMDATGADITYGLFAVTKKAIGNSDIVSSEGNIAAGAVMAPIPFDSFVSLTIKLAGFDTDELKKSEFAIGVYLAIDNGESKEYTYLQNDKPLEGAKYSFVSYNSVTNKQ